MKSRLEWLDIAKGIGIFLVVASHCMHIEKVPFQLVFTFHMQLFLLLSGFLFSGKDSFFALAFKKIRTLLIPFCGFFLLGLGATLLLPVWRSELSLTRILLDIWFADPNAVHNSSIWFLVALYFVFLVFWLIHRLPDWGQFLALLISYSLGTWYSRNQFPFLGLYRLPLNLDVVPVAVVFFALGYYARQSAIMQSLCKSWKRELFTALTCTAGVCLVYAQNGSVNLHGLSFGSAELYMLGGLLGSMAVVAASALIARGATGWMLWAKKGLIWYGQHSLTILGLQSLSIRLYIEAMNHFFGQELVLYNFSIKHTLVCTVLVAFVVCPAGCALLDLIKVKKSI